MDRHQLEEFRLSRNPSTGDLLLLIKRATLYKAVLSRAFPGLYFSRSFEDRYGQFSWGTYIKGANTAEEIAITDVCKLLQSAVFIDDDLDESFALAFHTQTSAVGGYERTEIGNLVFEAKPYDRARHPGNQQRVSELAALMAQFIQQHPTFQRADLLLSVPPSNRNKDYDLPSLLVSELSRLSGKMTISDAIRKVRETRPMKDCRTVQEKIDNVKDAYSVERPKVEGKAIILVDDIYQTGFSINEAARVLRNAGTVLLLGLVATKTSQDLSETEEP